MAEQSTDLGRTVAWGDMMMPEGADQRREGQAQRPQDSPTPPDAPLQQKVSPAPPEPSLREDTNAYAFGATTSQPAIGAGYARLPLGPGNEAMEGGASPAPRGYTGGAMGKFIAGLSPSFEEAARGDRAPGGDQIYTAGEAATTFVPGSGIARPAVDHSPEDVPFAPGDQCGSSTA